MNYDCPPDISSNEDLTVDAVKLFQRFRQSADLETVEQRTDQEFVRHLRLCELAILRAAAADYYWAELPPHPLQSIILSVSQHLEDKGFVVEHQRVAQEESIPSATDGTKLVQATVVKVTWTAKWLSAPSLDPDIAKAEWRRRAALEDDALKRNPPQRLSAGIGAELQTAAAVWAAVLDGHYIVEVQRLRGRSYLCLFDLDEGFRHAEKTSGAHGGLFGPDVSDIATWEQRAQQIVDAWRPADPSGS